MAYTKIIPIKKRLDICVNYVFSKNKTDLNHAIDYAFNQEKSNDNHVIYQSAINCLPSSAFKDMVDTKKKYDKSNGVQGYHIIQSFKPGEISPELAHKLGHEFAEQCFGARYEVILATHLDRDHIHNHIVINSVSFVDGKKYANTFGDYYHGIRETSDQRCREHGLSVIETRSENTSISYTDWLAEKRGKTSWTSIIKNDLDALIDKVPSYGGLLVTLEHMGYAFKNEKHLSLRPPGRDQLIRTYRLGKAYNKSEIISRLDAAYVARTQTASVVYRPSYRKYTTQAVPSFLKLYWRYMFLLGKVKKNYTSFKVSKYLKSELLKFEKYKAQYRFILKHKFKDASDVEARILHNGSEVKMLQSKLKKHKENLEEKQPLYNALTDYHQYKEAHELYLEGYAMMKDESKKYKKAKAVLSLDHMSIPDLTKQKTNDYEILHDLKQRIMDLKSDTRTCKAILASHEHIEEKTKQALQTKKRRIDKTQSLSR